MDEAVNRYARELADAISSAVSRDAQVEVCRQKARAAGYDMHVTLEALVGFAHRTPGARHRGPTAPPHASHPRQPYEITASDRRFLRSIRIEADEAAEEVK
jgi:hypothetical protein